MSALCVRRLVCTVVLFSLLASAAPSVGDFHGSAPVGAVEPDGERISLALGVSHLWADDGAGRVEGEAAQP